MYIICVQRKDLQATHLSSNEHILFLVSEYQRPLKGARVPQRNGWFQDWDRESTRSLRHLSVPRSKELLKKTLGHVKKIMDPA